MPHPDPPRVANTREAAPVDIGRAAARPAATLPMVGRRVIPEGFRELLTALPDAFLLASADGRILAANPHAAALLGRDASTVVERSLLELVADPPDRITAFLQGCTQARLDAPSTCELRPAGAAADRIHCEGTRVRPSSMDGPAWVLLGLRRRAADGRDFVELNEEVGELTAEVQERRRVEAALRETTERLTLALEAGRMGTWEWTIASGTVVWSEALERIHGLEPGTFDGSFDAFADDIHPADRGRVLETIATTVRERRPGYRIAYRIRRPDGEIRMLRAHGRLVLDPAGEPARMVGVCMDETERAAAEAREHLLAASGSILSASTQPEGALDDVARIATETLADVCIAYLRDADQLRPVAVAYADLDGGRLAEAVRGVKALGPLGLRSTHGIARAVRSGATVLEPRITDEWLRRSMTDARHLDLWRALDPQSLLVAPILLRGRVIGGLALATVPAGKRQLEQRDVRVIEELARRIASALEVARLLDELRDEVASRRRNERLLERQASRLGQLTRELEGTIEEIQSQQAQLTAAHRGLGESERRARFLVNAGQLLASSLDYEATLRHVAGLAVPEIADWCAVDLIEKGEIRRVAVAHPDPERQREVERLAEERPAHLDDPAGIGAVIRTGRAQVWPELGAAQLRRAARDPEELRLLRAIGLRSAILVPLEVGGEPIGCLTLAQSDSGRRFGDEDVELAHEFARRAAVAIENARLYARVSDAVRARDEVLAIVSHDLRNPLGAIQTTARTLIEVEPPERRRRELLERVIDSTRRADRLIDDLLEAAKVESGLFALDRRAVAPSRLVDEAVDTFREAARERSIELRGGARPSLPPVLADPDRVHRVLSNLLSNALRFTPEGGQVTVAAKSNGEFVEFSVVDSGPGVPAEERDHLFERFWQARRQSRAGAGLGLAIAKGIIDAHDGEIGVESEPGRGTTIRFTLPAADSED